MANAKTTTKERKPDQAQKPAGEAPKGNLAPAGQSEQRSKHPIVRFKEYADQRMATLNSALPPHISPEAFMSIALTAIQRKADLLKCTPQSLWNACIDAANLGLLPDGVEGAIAPFGQNLEGKRIAEIATFMPMIGGYRKKAYEGGLVAKWEVEVVRERDDFDHEKGDNAFIYHKPYFGAEEAGRVVGAYSIAKLINGEVMRDVMNLADLNKIRAKSKAGNGPWKDPVFEPEMYRKTMARRHFKQLPRTAALAKVIEHDDREFDLDHRSDEAIEDRRQRRLTTTTAAFDQFSSPGPVIENDEDLGSADDEPASKQDGDGEFAEADTDDAAKGGKPDGGAAPADQQQSGQQQPQGGGTQVGDTQSSEAGQQGSPGNDAEDRKWPEGQVPTNADEYQFYAETIIDGWTRGSEFDTGTSKIVGADGMPDWWKSKTERDLRTACGVTKKTFDTLVSRIKTKQAELRKGK